MISMKNNGKRLANSTPASKDDVSRDGLLLKDRAYITLKDLIKTGELPPGTFFSEKKLSAELGMSKTPIRAALERLEAEGFVAGSPRQGAVVLDLSIGEVLDLFDLRFALESFAIRGLAERLGRDQVAKLEDNLAAQRECLEAEDVQRYTQLDADFHITICEFFGNREITRVVWNLRDKLYRVILRVMIQNPGRVRSSYEEHVKIVAALSDGDDERSVSEMTDHLDFGKQLLISRGR